MTTAPLGSPAAAINGSAREEARAQPQAQRCCSCPRGLCWRVFSRRGLTCTAAVAAAWYSSNLQTACGMTCGASAMARNSTGVKAEIPRMASRATLRFCSDISFQSGGHTSASGELDPAPIRLLRRLAAAVSGSARMQDARRVTGARQRPTQRPRSIHARVAGTEGREKGRVRACKLTDTPDILCRCLSCALETTLSLDQCDTQRCAPPHAVSVTQLCMR